MPGGGFVLIQREVGLYEAHSLFLPEMRSRSVKAMRAGFDYMFTQTNCEKIITQVPDDNRPAAALAKLAGFRPMFRREETERGPTAFMGFSVDDWAMGNAPLERDGEWFHDRIEAAKRASNSTLPDHPHDAAHNQAAGAAVRMVKSGNTAKAASFYNRWAACSGYPPISIVSLNPPIFDMGEAIVSWDNYEMQVLLCR